MKLIKKGLEKQIDLKQGSFQTLKKFGRRIKNHWKKVWKLGCMR